jgi:hypothetical protein
MISCFQITLTPFFLPKHIGSYRVTYLHPSPISLRPAPTKEKAYHPAPPRRELDTLSMEKKKEDNKKQKDEQKKTKKNKSRSGPNLNKHSSPQTVRSSLKIKTREMAA